MICKNCAAEIKVGVKFCTNCGSKIEDTTVEVITDKAVETATEPKVVAEKSENEPVSLTEEKPEVESVHVKVTPEVQKTDGKTSVAKKEKKKFGKKKILALVASTVAVIAIVVASIVISENAKIKPIEEAIEMKDGAALCYAFDGYVNAGYDLSKCDELFYDTISEINISLGSDVFDATALEYGSEAVENFLRNEWGSLVYPDEEYYENDHCLRRCIESLGEYELPESYSSYNWLDEQINLYKYYCQAVYDEANGDYLSAYKNYQNAFIGGYIDVVNADENDIIKNCITNYLNSLNDQAGSLITDGDYSGAIKVYEDGKQKLIDAGYVAEDDSGDGKTDVDVAIDEAIGTYAAEFAEKAEEYFKQGDIDAAIGHIEIALEFVPDNEDYNKKLETYESYKPFPLYYADNYLEMQDGENFIGTVYFNRTATSNDNTQYEHCIYWYNKNDVNACDSVIYNLDGKYDAVKGTLFLCAKEKNNGYPSYIEIYGDGKLLYTSPKIKAGVLPQDIDVDISGVHKLKVSFYAIGDGSSIFGFYGTGHLSDFVAYKKLPTENSEG
ncbi:MAG: hypothetical protein E7556_08300 [Ruminococcaceae bacterium]|nr:hypothetical protein [Oscillospiraceae bacterium]